jgi:hypothetical protein
MDVKKAIEHAKMKNEQAKLRMISKQTNRPVSVSGILQVMNEQMMESSYGFMNPITKETRNKVHGFIKFLKNNDYQDSEIYDFIKNCIKNWDILKNLQIKTDNKKKYTLDTKPNILDIINCKQDFITELSLKFEEKDDSDVDFLEEWSKL